MGALDLRLPAALLLLVPLGALLLTAARRGGAAQPLRLAAVVLAVLALAGPGWVLARGGADVVLVADVSRSMPPEAPARAEEAARLLAAQRRPGDRLGVVAFARGAAVELPPSERGAFGGFTHALDAEGSDLGAGLDAAGALVPEGRAARVLVLSDGRATGPQGAAEAAARRLAARGIPVDFRHLARADAPQDVAVVALDAPPRVGVREPFQLAAEVVARAPVRARVRLLRDGRVLVDGPVDLPAGRTRLPLRDLVEAPGLARYRLEVQAPGDGLPQNDVGEGVTRVEGPPRVLLVTARPRGALARALAQGGLALDVRAPGPLTLDALDGVDALVLEDVDASALGEGGLRAVAAYVDVAGGGLVMTGGRHSFGEGGYRRSPVEDVLPVSLEMREEQRRVSLAMSVLMDSSCSMGARVPDGRTKMELAAEGVVAALSLLDGRDEASVHMVDTEPKEVFPLSPVSDGLPLDEVARGFSGGGGIYVGVALRTGREEILRSDKPTRHVVLFSDAADSEEPEDYAATLAQLRAKDVTVSVIGLGTEKDPDAALLKDVARRGGGRVYFADDALSLPRIFSQETLAVARAAFVDAPTSMEGAPDLPLVARVPVQGLPQLGGYNLTYLKPRASAGLRTLDDNGAPVLAFWQRGAGRAVAFTGEVEGAYSGELAGWPHARTLYEAAVRWAQGARAEDDAGQVVARSSRQGDVLRVTLDVAEGVALPATAPSVVLLPGDGRREGLEVPMRWEGEGRAVAEVRLPGSGTWHPVVRLGQRALRAAPVALPYAPEFEPAPPGAGRETLEAVARAGGGVERLSFAGLFADAPESPVRVDLAPWLAGAALLTLLAEVWARKLRWKPLKLEPRAQRPTREVRGKELRAPKGTRTGTPVAPEPEPPRPPEDAKPPEPPTVDDALQAARTRSKGRTRR